jgi:hypothetical protein
MPPCNWNAWIANLNCYFAILQNITINTFSSKTNMTTPEFNLER